MPQETAIHVTSKQAMTSQVTYHLKTYWHSHLRLYYLTFSTIIALYQALLINTKLAIVYAWSMQSELEGHPPVEMKLFPITEPRS